MKVTYNLLRTKKDKLDRKIYVWRVGKGKGVSRPSKDIIRKFKALRTKAGVKRERKKREFIETFKPHKFRSKNVRFITYCEKYSKTGINRLNRLFRLKLRRYEHIRFFLGHWIGFCLDKTVKCPKRHFYAHRKKDKYKLPRYQTDINIDNFTDKLNTYIGGVTSNECRGIYKTEVCPRCPSDKIAIEVKSICVQIVEVIK